MLPELLVTLAAAVPSVDCPEHIESPPAPAEQRRRAIAQSVTSRGVIFWGLRNAATRLGRDDEGWKAAISVRHGAPLRLRVAWPDRDRVALDYDRETRGEWAREQRIVPCPPDTPRFSDDGVVGDETAYAGGFLVKRPGCVTLLLRREDEEQWRKVRVGFGRRC